jgi:hypothetical protein
MDCAATKMTSGGEVCSIVENLWTGGREFGSHFAAGRDRPEIIQTAR